MSGHVVIKGHMDSPDPERSVSALMEILWFSELINVDVHGALGTGEIIIEFDLPEVLS